jgi:hypothetical protein
MRRGLLILAFISLSPLAQAADCFIGKWRLDAEKSYVDSLSFAPLSKVHPDVKLKRGSATFTPDGKNGYTLEMSGESNHGPFAMGAPVTFEGHAYEGLWGGKTVVFTSKRVGDHGFKVLIANEQTLKVTEVLLFNVSSDDMTLVFSDLRVGEKSPFLTMVFNRNKR